MTSTGLRDHFGKNPKYDQNKKACTNAKKHYALYIMGRMTKKL